MSYYREQLRKNMQYFILEKDMQLDENKYEWNFENINCVVTIDIDATISDCFFRSNSHTYFHLSSHLFSSFNLLPLA